MSDAKYLGIDLGTSNSAVAVFEGGEVNTILNTLGDVNTPSVVRVTQNNIVVGTKAQRNLYADPNNTFKEFKRLMGTQALSKEDHRGHCWSPDELSAEVLKALKELAEAHTGYDFDKVVVTVPALFELPQSNATANAARLANFTQVELLPEPVASGLAAGWSEDQQGVWLVYDLGGGTFDASLLESRDGLLRVVGHDGDNFLGGRDIDREIVNWVKAQLEEQCQIILDTSHKDYPKALRQIQSAAEKAKIRLSSTEQSIVELDFEYDGDEVQHDLSITGDILKDLSKDLVQRSIDICKRLLTAQGVDLEHLNRVVLVGGPAHMPIIKEAVTQQLAPLAEVNIDPMSLVARGAALYAATINLACTAKVAAKEDKPDYQVWLQYPSVCTELNPTVMGRIIDDALPAAFIQVINRERHWESPLIDVEDGIFICEVAITPGKKNSFQLKAFDKSKSAIDLAHQSIDIVHGLTMSDPPLSRSIGVALADGSTKNFIDRGTPLPAKRTFVQSSVDTLVPGSGQKLTIPIIQGERRKARFCRNVGSLVIDSSELQHTLHVGSPIEITIEVDRGGDLKAQAFIADQGKIIDGVANLVIADASEATLQASYQGLNTRVTSRFHEAFREKNESLIAKLEPLSTQLQTLKYDMQELSGNTDTCQRVLRNLMEIEAEIEHIENEDHILELVDECELSYFNTAGMVNDYGDSADKRILDDCAKHLEKIIKYPRQGDLERLVERLDALNHSAHKKSPDFWKDIFSHWSSFAHQATNPKRAQAIVAEGRKAMEKNEMQKLKSLTNELFGLIPQQYRGDRGQSYDSGIY